MVLIAHAMTTAQHGARFPQSSDELSATGVQQCHRERRRLEGRLLLSPAVAARRTADELGWSGGVECSLADEQHYGDWAGVPLEALGPAAVEVWRRTGDVPGGESLRELLLRVTRLLSELPPGRTTVLTHQCVLRGALVVALGCGEATFWDIEAEPLSEVVLRRTTTGRWRLHVPLRR